MKPKRSIYRVIPIMEKRKLIGWKVTGPGGYTVRFLRKALAILLARNLAGENKPSQVLVSRKSRTTGKYRIKLEWSYGADSRAKG